MLIRALIYRMTTEDVVRGPDFWSGPARAAYEPVIELALSYAD
jgi:hypothetical protein